MAEIEDKFVVHESEEQRIARILKEKEPSEKESRFDRDYKEVLQCREEIEKVIENLDSVLRRMRDDQDYIENSRYTHSDMAKVYAEIAKQCVSAERTLSYVQDIAERLDKKLSKSS